MDPKRWLGHAPGAAVVALAGILRFLDLGSESLWIDEAASLYYVREHSLAELALEVPLVETHPPLYYTLLDLWTSIAGTSPTALRAPSAVFGVGSVAVVYVLGCRWANRRTGLAASLLLAVSTLHVSHAQEARMYSLLTFAAAASFLALSWVRENPTWGRQAVYVGSLVLLGYSHVLGLLVAGAHVVAVLHGGLHRGELRAAWRSWAPRWGAAGLGLLPWLVVLGRRVLGGDSNRLSWISSPTAADLLATPGAHLGLETAIGSTGLLAVGVASTGLVVLGLAGTESSRGWPALAGWWLGALLLVPFVVSLALFPIYTVRYTVAAGPALFLLVVRGTGRLDPDWARLGVAVALVVSVVVPLGPYYTQDQREQWDEAASYVETRADPGQPVLVANHEPGWIETITAFEYYTDRSDLPVHGVPDDVDAARIGELVDGPDTAWAVLSHMEEGTRDRLRSLVRDEVPGPVQTRDFVGIEVLRFGNSSEPAAR